MRGEEGREGKGGLRGRAGGGWRRDRWRRGVEVRDGKLGEFSFSVVVR